MSGREENRFAGEEAPRKRYYIAPEDRARQSSGRSSAPSGKRGAKPASRRPAPARRKAVRRPPAPQRPRRVLRVKDKNRLICTLIVAAILLVIAGIFLDAVRVVGINNEKFYPGVSVNGINLSGYTLQEGLQLVTRLTDERLNHTYTFTWKDKSWDFRACDIDADIKVSQKVGFAYNMGHVGNLFTRKQDVQRLKEHPVSYICEIEYSEEKLDAFIDSIAQVTDIAPIEAVVVADVSTPVVVSGSTNGLALDREGLKQTIIDIMNTGEGSTELVVNTAFPRLSTEDAYLCTELLVTYQTDTTFRNMYSTANVRLALSNFNGFCLEPGETFSFNAIVGDRTNANGYVEAVEYAGGNTQMGIGGGVCQASTTLYGALLKCGITPLQRGNHTMVVSYVDPGLDAAVAYGTKDLMMRNDTDYPVYCYTEVKGGFATVKVYGHRPEYRIELASEILEKIPPKDVFKKDTKGEYTKHEGETVLVNEGHDGCRSQSYLVYYDWDTGEEVERKELSRDYYYPMNNEYYVGMFMPAEGN